MRRAQLLLSWLRSVARMERSVIRGPASPRGTGCGEALPAFRFAPCGLREILFHFVKQPTLRRPFGRFRDRGARACAFLRLLPPKRGAERQRGARAAVRRPHLACLRGTLKDACEASPCPLRSGHSPCGAPLRRLRIHRPFSSRGRPSAGDEPARGSRPRLRPLVGLPEDASDRSGTIDAGTKREQGQENGDLFTAPLALLRPGGRPMPSSRSHNSPLSMLTPIASEAFLRGIPAGRAARDWSVTSYDLVLVTIWSRSMTSNQDCLL